MWVALLAALAIGMSVVLGGVGGVYAAPPVFDTTVDPSSRSIPENTPAGVNIGPPISATDGDEDGEDNNDVEFGDTLTYSLGGADAASFDIDASTGQLITKAPLDFEEDADPTYSVTVTVKDSMGNSADQGVTITVTDVAEAPGALAAPTVVSADTDSDATTYELTLIWHAPDDPGDGVAGYGVQYKETTATSFTDVTHSGTATTATITGLEADTSYQVRVRATGATTGAENGPWSISSVGATNKENNNLPTFAEGATAQRNVLENADPGLPVGFRVSASDSDNLIPLAYQLHGPDANSFDLQASTGQIRTKRGVVYDFEKKPTLNVTVTVSDGQGGSDAIAVTISVTNVPEAPEAPARPTVRATPGSSTSLEVNWKEPDNMGSPIEGYDIRYRKSNSGQFILINPSPTGTGTTYTLAPQDDDTTDIDESLTPGASYEVSVRARNGESPSGWSAAGTGRTGIGNSEPVFDDRTSVARDTDGTLPAASTDRTVAENTRAGQSIGSAVRAVDGNGDGRTYRLAPATVEAHMAKFDINSSTGQILTKEPLNHEATDCDYDDTADPTECMYTVRVQVWDGLDQHRNEQDTDSLNDDDFINDGAVIDDTITVNIMVSDVNEKPTAPTVTVASPTDGTTTSLVVTWDEPENAGPDITGYQLECTGHEVPDDQCPTDILTSAVTDRVGTHTITDLTTYKSYRVRVRANNNEDNGEWSSWVTQSTNKENNILPGFTSPPANLYVVENAASARQPLTNVGGDVTTIPPVANDGDSPLTLRLDGPGASRFDIDNNGQIRTTAKLNYEDPGCNPTGAATCTYRVRVKISDPNGGSFFHPLTINVTDVIESPASPAAPRVTATAGSGWSLQVTWNEPRNDGPSITGYQIRYRESAVTGAIWQQWPTDGSNVTDRSARITTSLEDPTDNTSNQVHLEPSTRYQVQVRALNGEGDSTFAESTNWSTSGQGSTGPSNGRPVFVSMASVIELEVEENTRSGQNVGSAVEATDPDGPKLTYSLEGPGKDSFTITSTGQVKTRSSLNHEERDEYSLTVKVNDGQGKDNSVAAKSVTIEITDRTEQPSTPRAPTVAGIPDATDSVRVTWDEPANTGPAITHYSVQYAVAGSQDAFQRVTVPIGNADRSAIITGLTAGTRYEVQVRAESPEGHSDWSSSGRGSPNPDVTNRNPAFSNRSHTFSVAENTASGANVGSPVAALDPDGDTLTYILEGVDADSFDIIVSNGAGQIQTKAALNFEEKSSYSVAVRARDGRGGTDAVNVTIRVADVDTEAPDTPFAPTVATISSTSLQINWEAPANSGPAITDYDYRYQQASGTWTEVTTTTITGTTATITGLRASTSYDVEVRAKNAEGTSDWSNPGIGSTNAAGANNRPVFSEGISATRSVSASSPAGTSIGQPVAATDADSGDKLTYSIGGRDAGLFDLNTATGQLRTKAILLADETYTVTVTADDGTDTAPITVSIEATPEPPNILPVFSEGASASRSVARTAAAGTSIGQPLRATDADTGDTITYSLEGTDAASFGINASTGQLLTLAGVTLAGRDHSVTVVATDDAGGRATISVTITVTDSPGTVSLSPSRPTVGDTVTASLTDPDGGVTGPAWQWAISPNGTSNWTIVLGATSSTFTVTVAHEGRYLRATASYTDAAGPGKSAETVTTAAVREDDDGSVSLSPARPTAGDTVTATVSDPDGGVTGVTWQWAISPNGTSNWTIVLGATASSYTTTELTQGSYLRATASYTDSAGPGKRAQAVTLAAVVEDDDGSVSLSSSSPKVGDTVTATLTDPDGGITGPEWQWASSTDGSTWTDIPGATSATYTAVANDEGSYLRATASYDDSVGDDKSAEAATSSKVAPPNLIAVYDSNGDGLIERAEAVNAVRDYFNDDLTQDEVIIVLTEYFKS